jgi:hypothetical protein
VPASGISGLHCTLRTGHGYDKRFQMSVCLRPILVGRDPIHVYTQISTRLSTVDEALLNLALACIRVGPGNESAGKSSKFPTEGRTNSRVLPVGVSSRAASATSVNLLLDAIVAIIVAQVAARPRDGTHVEVDPLGVAEVVAASEALARVEVGRLDGAEVAGFGEGVVQLFRPAFTAGVAAALGEPVDWLGALDGGAGGEGCC